MKPENRLRAKDYRVETLPLALGREMVRKHHYAKGSSNTATFRHGLMRGDECVGCALWLPPTKNAAKATYDGDWRAVIALSRLVILPDEPTNAASFLIGRSIRLIRQDPRWECLVTYADDYQGHSGAIYRATNWEYVGKTKPTALWLNADGRMVARKAGPKTRTKAEMEALGYRMAGRYSKHKYRMIL